MMMGLAWFQEAHCAPWFELKWPMTQRMIPCRRSTRFCRCLRFCHHLQKQISRCSAFSRKVLRATASRVPHLSPLRCGSAGRQMFDPRLPFWASGHFKFRGANRALNSPCSSLLHQSRRTPHIPEVTHSSAAPALSPLLIDGLPGQIGRDLVGHGHFPRLVGVQLIRGIAVAGSEFIQKVTAADRTPGPCSGRHSPSKPVPMTPYLEIAAAKPSCPRWRSRSSQSRSVKTATSASDNSGYTHPSSCYQT